MAAFTMVCLATVAAILSLPSAAVSAHAPPPLLSSPSRRCSPDAPAAMTPPHLRPATVVPATARTASASTPVLAANLTNAAPAMASSSAAASTPTSTRAAGPKTEVRVGRIEIGSPSFWVFARLRVAEVALAVLKRWAGNQNEHAAKEHVSMPPLPLSRGSIGGH